MKSDDGWKRLIENDLEGLRTDVDSLKTWRAWVLGAATAIGILFGVFGKMLAGKVGLNL